MAFRNVPAFAVVNAVPAINEAPPVDLLSEALLAVLDACEHHLARPRARTVGTFPLVDAYRAGPISELVFVEVRDLLASSSNCGIARVPCVGP